MKRHANTLLRRLGYQILPIDERPSGISTEPAIEPEYLQILNTIEISGKPLDPNQETLYSVYTAVLYVIRNGIGGDFVECGVGEGPKIALMTATLLHLGISDRSIYMYDTFSGLTEPSEKDYKFWGPLSTPEALMKKWEAQNLSNTRWGSTPLDVVKNNVDVVGYPAANLHYVEGDVRSTLPNNNHRKIAILRLDTDFYDSSLHELRHLYDLVVRGGVVIFDDYGGFAGQKAAVDEFFAKRGEAPMLVRTSAQERVMKKT